MKIRLPLLALLAGATGAHCLPPDVSSNYELVWEDQFTGIALNREFWDYDTNLRRIAHNVVDAVSVANGNLVIKTYTENGKHYTGFISTKEKFSQPFGYFEARIKFHDASGMWSAFWLMPYTMEAVSDPLNFVDYPNISGVEMDIVEHRVVTQNGTNIENKINTALHWDGYSKKWHARAHVDGESAEPDLDNPLTDFYHTYGVEWTPRGYKVYCDDQLIWQTVEPPVYDELKPWNDGDKPVEERHHPPASPQMAVSHRSGHVILSSEIEGGKNDTLVEGSHNYTGAGWAGNVPAGGYGSKNSTQVKMTVDWVRVYARKPSASGQRPFKTHPFPGVIEAEDFDKDINPNAADGLNPAEILDEKGKFVSYYDKNQKNGYNIPGLEYGTNLTYRPDTKVDLNASATASGNLYVAHAILPEWLEYTVNAQKRGFYAARVRVANATADGAETRVFVDSRSLGGVSAISTGGAESWKTLSLPRLLEIENPRTIVARVEFFDKKQPINFDAFQFDYLGNVAELKEAESALLAGGAATADTDSASGGRTAAFPAAAGASARWTGVDGFNGGQALLTFRFYATGSGTNARTLDLYVNGTKQETLTFPSTTLRSYENLSTQANLVAGKNNTLELRVPPGGSRPLNLDYLVVSKEVPIGPVTTMREAETAIRTGTFTEIAATAASGGIAIDGIGGENNAITWNNIPGSGGSATVTIRYARGGSADAKKSLFVNGVLIQQLNFPATTTWANYQTVSRQITLPAGNNNTIMLKNNGSADDNLNIRVDNITVTQ